MSRTRVKICGLSEPESLRAAVSAGADALGFVLYPPSPRAVTLEQLAQLAPEVPAFVSIVALLVNPSEAEVRTVIESGCVDLIQFHGDETAEFCEQFSFPYYRALRVGEAKGGLSGTELSDCIESFTSARAVLLDAFVPGISGGTGQSFDWQLIPDTDKALILAGGLDAGNVGQAIRQHQPYAVDVSGGVEQARGIKDADKIHAFIAAVHAADSEV